MEEESNNAADDYETPSSPEETYMDGRGISRAVHDGYVYDCTWEDAE